MAITVDPRNTAYTSVDGVVFDKTGKTLVMYPNGKTEAYSIPNGVTTIGGGAFSGCANLTSVTIPASVTAIGYGAFAGCDALRPDIKAALLRRFGEKIFYDPYAL